MGWGQKKRTSAIENPAGQFNIRWVKGGWKIYSKEDKTTKEIPLERFKIMILDNWTFKVTGYHKPSQDHFSSTSFKDISNGKIICFQDRKKVEEFSGYQAAKSYWKDKGYGVDFVEVFTVMTGTGQLANMELKGTSRGAFNDFIKPYEFFETPIWFTCSGKEKREEGSSSWFVPVFNVVEDVSEEDYAKADGFARGAVQNYIDALFGKGETQQLGYNSNDNSMFGEDHNIADRAYNLVKNLNYQLSSDDFMFEMSPISLQIKEITDVSVKNNLVKKLNKELYDNSRAECFKDNGDVELLPPSLRPRGSENVAGNDMETITDIESTAVDVFDDLPF